MIKKILILVSLIYLSGCSLASFEKGLNYEKKKEYSFDYDKGTQNTIIIDKKSKNHISIRFKRHYCGFYGLTGPLIFPVMPIWQNDDCKDVVIGISKARKVHILYKNKLYKPSKIVRGGGYFFPLPIKSITDTAILVIEKKDGEIFKIPFRYQHTFSFDLWPGR